METTDYNRAWRANRFDLSKYQRAELAVATNFNYLADNPANAEGVSVAEAATKAAGRRVDAIDVALWYLARAVGSQRNGPINRSGMFAEIGGNPGLEFPYKPGTSEPGSENNAAFGIGADFKLPAMRVRASRNLDIGTGGPRGRIHVDQTFPLPVPDPNLIGR